MTAGIVLLNLAGLFVALAALAQASPRSRLGGIAAATIALYLALHGRHRDTALAFWSIVLIAINLLQLARFGWGERRSRFTPADEHLRSVMLPGLSRSHARALIDRGTWVNGKADERLLTEGETASHLYFLHDGAARVSFQGAPVGACGAGELIGDATALSGAPATATVDLSAPSQLWCIFVEDLRQHVALHAEVRAVLERQLNDALRGKLSSANQLLAEARA